MAMAVKPEPIDIEAEQTLLTNSTNGSPARRPPNAHGEAAAAISRVTSHPVNLTSHPVNFLTEQGGRPEMVVDPVQEDVVFLPPRPLGGRGHGRREVTEYATYTISHHEAELNSKLLPKKYRCRFCIYKTSYKSDLNRHLRKHGIAPQHCPLCNMPFKTTGNLENHMRQIHGDFVSSLGIIPSSSVPGLGAVEDGLVPPMAVGALGGVVGFAAQGSKADAELLSACEEGRRRHRQLRLQLQQDFPAAVSQVVLSPATQLSCHVCPFVCSDSEVLARHLLTHPSEDEASRAERSSPPLSDLRLTRLACNYCGTVLSSIDHLQIHRRSCVNPEDSQREGSRGLNSAVSPTGWQCDDDEGSSGDNEKVGVPRQETMDRLRRSITNSRDEARARPAKSRSPASRIRGSWNLQEQKSMVLPIIPAAESVDDVERTDQSRTEPYHDRHHLETSSGELLVVSSPEEGSYESVMEVENDTVNRPRDLTTHPADTPTSAAGASRSLTTPSESHLEHNGRRAERKETLPAGQKRPLMEPGSRTDAGGEPRRIVTRRNKRGGSEDLQELPETVQKAVRTSPTDRGEADGPTEMNMDSEDSVETCPEVAGERGHVSVRRNKAPHLPDSRNKWPKSADNSKEAEGVGRLPSRPGELQVHHNLDQAGERLSIKDEPKSPETSMKYETLESSGTYDDLSFLRSELVRSTSPAGPPAPSVAGGSHREFEESCVLCEQRFSSRAHLVRHLQRAHSLLGDRTLSSAEQASTASDSRNYVSIQVGNSSQQSPSSGTADPEREREGRRGGETVPRSKPSTPAYFVPSGPASSASAVVLPAGGGSSSRSEDHQRFSSLAFPADSRGERAASLPPDRGRRDARVASQPPTSGRYARLVSDFDEFAAKPYACALCFFRTASLGDLRVHVHNHLTGCNASPVPDTARFQPMEAFHVERSTSPLRMDSSAASSVNSVSPVSVVASDTLAASADFHVSFAHARGGLRPAFDQGGSLGYHVIGDDHRASVSDGESDQSPVNCADGQPPLSSTTRRPNGTHVNVDAISTDGSGVVDLSSRTVGETRSPAVSQAVDSGDVTPSSLPGDGRDDEERGHDSAEAETRADDADDAHRGGVGPDEFLETPASLNTSEERLCDAEHSAESALDDSDLHGTGDLRMSSRSSNSLDENRLDAEHPAEDVVQRPSSGTLDGSLLVADHNAEDGQCPPTRIVDKGLLAGDRPFSDTMDQGLLDADHTEDDDRRLTEAFNSQPNQPPKRSTRTAGTRQHTSKTNLPPEANSGRKVHRKQARRPSPKTIIRAQRRRTVWLRAGLSRTRPRSDGSSNNRCETCGKRFSLGTLLARHLRFVHVA